jgi:hypothetical protein
MTNPETKQARVTGTRYFSGKLSPSRNEADRCVWCDEAFKPGRMRYPIMNYPTSDREKQIYGLASVCMDCFKWGMECWGDNDGYDAEGTFRRHRNERTCRGCGEPILTITNARRGQWDVCSDRCYQRHYRKRRRGRESVIEWKGFRRQCESCQGLLESRRRDARFCSNRCRQWHYRRKHGAGSAS